MSGTVWVPGAERLTPVGTAGTMLGGPPRVVWHTTEAPSGGRYWDAMIAVLRTKKAEPHVLYDPLTDRLGQFFPLDASARAVQNDDASGTKTNRTGAACIQIEVVAMADAPFTATWRPGPNFRALMAAIRSWGIPDAWPGGRMAQHEDDRVSRDVNTWRTAAGHYGHCHVPGNTHWDAGPIDQAAIFAAAPNEEDDLTPEQAQQLAEVHKELTQRLPNRVDGKTSDTLLGYALNTDEHSWVIRQLLTTKYRSAVGGSTVDILPVDLWRNADAYGFQMMQALSGMKAAVDTLAAAVATQSGVTPAELQDAVTAAIQKNVVKVNVAVAGKES